MSFGGGGTISTEEPRIGALSIQSSAFGLPIALFWGKTRISGNLVWYGDFTPIAHTSTQSAGGKGGGGVETQNTSYTYTAAFILALGEGGEGGVSAVERVWNDKEKTTFAALGMTLLPGTLTQAVWSHLSTNHPSEAIAYPGIAAVAHSAFDLGSSASIGNMSFEVSGPRQFGGGIVDARPDEIVTDMLTAPLSGAGFPASRLSLALYRTYTQAAGLFLSPWINSQQPASQHLDEILQATNSAAVWSEGLLKILPYGDTAITGNGATYTPAITPQYDLTDDDFMPPEGQMPIRIRRKTPADAFNQVTVEFKNRANEYNLEPAVAKDQGNISTYGLRQKDPLRLHMICDSAVAQHAAEAIKDRALYVVNEYEFELGWRHCRLEPMDIVTLTHAPLWLDHFQVRIIDIEEDERGMLRVVAEEFPFGVATPALIQTQSASGYSVDYNVTPPASNAPILFEAPVAIAQNGLEVWAALSGAPGWGGCDVWVSSDNAHFKRVGTIHGGARMGVLSAGLNVGPDPDTIDTLAVDLTQSAGTLISGTQADADAFHTLCYVGGELLSYQNATLTAANKYSLTYLRRGAYGSTIGSHAAGAAFARLDEAIFTYPYSADQIGKTLYFKFPAFNVHGLATQDLSACTVYTHTLAGPPAPPNVGSLSVKQSGGTVVFTWPRVNDFALKGYDIRYGAPSLVNWADLTPLTEAAMGTEMTNASVPPGAWQFAIRARDIADQLSPAMTTTTLTVTNENATIATRQECPGLDGTVSGFVKHWTGVLVPDSQFVCSHYSNWEDFGVSFAGSTPYVPDPVASATYTQNAQDTAVNDTLRVWPIITATPGPGVVGTPNTTFSLDYWLSGASDPNTWNAWASGSAAMRYFRGRVTETPGTVPSYISVFTVTADKQSASQIDGANLTVAAGGTNVTFTTPFHSPPFVSATVIGGTALFASVNNITATGCTIHVFNTSGTDVGGTVNWTASGF